MGRYQIKIKETAQKDLLEISTSGDLSTIQKVETIFHELEEYPKTGTGKPELLRYELSGFWSRRLNRKDRIIYEIDENEAVVTVLSVLGHY
ncbi:MAG: Txe/YoeB family addiction module toxin [Bacteroidales bacterium]|nr:Txe/YoeB family addiction module toxin [Bacteroidales bacterium]